MKYLNSVIGFLPKKVNQVLSVKVQIIARLASNFPTVHVYCVPCRK